jgi:hypothetical protein
MDKSEVKKWVDENIEPMMRLMGIPHWRIDVSYTSIPDTAADIIVGMDIKTRPQYEKAYIRINYSEYESVEDLERDLKHEMMHIMHSPYELAWDLVETILTVEQAQAVGKIWRSCEEMTVRNLERMHHGHTQAMKGEE